MVAMSRSNVGGQTLVASSCLTFLALTSLALHTVTANSDNNNNSNKCLHHSNTFKVDCHPDSNATEGECLSRGCCWLINEDNNNKRPPYVGQPSCFFPADFNCYYMKQIAPQQEEQEPHERKDYSLNDAAHVVVDDDDDVVGRLPLGPFASGKRARNGHETPADSIRLLLVRKPECQRSGFVDDASELEVSVSVYGDSIINIKIREPDRKRFEPSLPELKLPRRKLNGKRKGADSLNDDVPVGDDDDHDGKKLTIGQLVVHLISGQSSLSTTSSSSTSSFHGPGSVSVLKVIHRLSGAVLFEADFGKLIYSRRFIQLPTYLPSPFVYGLGQHLGESLLKSSDGNYAKSYTMFNYGHPPQPDGRTAYSTYPFYINLAQLSTNNDIPTTPPPANVDVVAVDQSSSRSSNRSRPVSSIESFERRRKLMATGALMLNSNAMDVLLHSKINQQTNRAGITWRLIGGIVDLYLFAGPQPHDVIRQYQSLVGQPQLPPAWALGYHQSRMNYRDLLQIKLAWAKTRSAGIPMESIWTDLEFMWRATSYTLNNNELNELVQVIQKDFDMHYVPIVDPAISIREDMANYEALKLAESMDLFAYYPPPGGIGESSTAVVTTWTESKQAGVLDFTHPRIVNYLRQVLTDYKSKLNFDGIWLDMNEPEIFANEPDEAGQVCPNDEALQYLPGDRPLNDRTLCMSAEFRLGKHYDLHNLFAFYQSKAHHETFRLLNYTRRPFIISRSQFVGQGKYSGSWLGDMSSMFPHLSWSLIGTIESNWFGQPLIGADICGFFGSTTDELCARWFSLGAFYPLARNHNEGSSRDQDPGSLDESVQQAARVGIMRRYSLLPYLYSLFYENHLQGSPVIRSILFESFEEFYLNSELSELPQINDQLMWGSALMIAPIMEADTEFRSVYLAPGRWYDVSIGLPGTNMELGEYDALTSNWPASNSSDLNEFTRKRLASMRRPIDCHKQSGCLLEHQYTPVGAINVFLRGGNIVPTFRNVNHEKSVNGHWKNASFFLEIGLNLKDEAFGSLYWDDGESAPEANLYSHANFWLSHNRLMVSAIETNFEQPLSFDGFIVYGGKLSSEHVPEPSTYRGSKLQYSYDKEMEILKCLFVSPVDERTTKPLAIGRFEKLIFKW